MAHETVSIEELTVKRMLLLLTPFYHYNFIDGILGLSPIDDSSGPLLVDYLWRQGELDEFKFAII